MKLQIIVRRASAEDIAHVSRLFVELDEHHIRLRPDLFKQLDGPARTLETLGELVADSELQAIFVASTSSDEIIGLVHVREKRSPETGVVPATRDAEIDSLVIDGPYRGFGAARALVAQAEDWARERGFNQIILNVRAFNIDAIAAYEALGFEHIVHRMARPILR